MLRTALTSIIFFLFAESSIACSCVNNNATACSSLAGTPVVFVGKVIRDTGEGIGMRFGRMVVEQVLHGIPADLSEVDIDTMPFTSCYMPLEDGERYVIYGSRDPKDSKLIHYHVCSFSFRVRGHETLLDALLSAEAGAPSRLLGVVTKRTEKYGGGSPAPGIKVVAQRDTTRFETLTNAEGEFQFQVISPGDWTLKVESAGFVHDSEHDFPRDALIVPTNGCQYRQLSVVSDGHIRGRVRDSQGVPVAGVPVQVFNFSDYLHEFDSLKFAEAKTGPDGSYDIGALPAQDYVVGINAEKYDDKIAYAPTYFGSGRERNEARRITLKEGEQRYNIDITLPPKRLPATLIVHLEFDDGNPVTFNGIPKNAEEIEARGSRPTSFGGVSVMDIQETQRGRASDNPANANGVFQLSLWKDEVYKIRAWRMEDAPLPAGPGGVVRLSFQEWEGFAGPIKLTDAETHLRIVLYPKVRELDKDTGRLRN